MGNEKEVSGYDDFGVADNSRHEIRNEPAEEDAQGVAVEASSISSAAANRERSHGGSFSQNEAELAEEFLLGIQHTEWAGPLPPPETLHAYTLEEQSKIMAWSDAMILDESERSDKLVDAIISSTKREQWLSFLSATIPTLAAFVTFLVTQNPLSLSFLAVPGITIAVNVIGAVRNKDNPSD